MKEIQCKALRIARLIGKKWVIPVVEELYYTKGTCFNDLKSKMKVVTPRELSLLLSNLVSNGFVKKLHKNNKVIYKLNNNGYKLKQIIDSIKLISNDKDNKCYGKKCLECDVFLAIINREKEN